MSVIWTTDFINKPSGKRNAGLIDDFIQETREAVGERISREHKLGDISAPSLDGSHKRGSARVYVGSTAPTPPTMQAEDAGDEGTLAIGRQWLDTATGILYTYDGTSWIPAGAFYGQIVLAGQSTYVPDGFVACDGTAHVYSDGTKTVYVPALDDAFLKIGAGYSGGWTAKTTAAQFTHTITETQLPPHAHDMDHYHDVKVSAADGVGADTGFRLTQSNDADWISARGAWNAWFSSPKEREALTDKLNTGNGLGESEEIVVDITEPPHVEILAYCFVGELSLV